LIDLINKHGYFIFKKLYDLVKSYWLYKQVPSSAKYNLCFLHANAIIFQM
jgi:hypothetical protein